MLSVLTFVHVALALLVATVADGRDADVTEDIARDVTDAALEDALAVGAGVARESFRVVCSPFINKFLVCVV